MEQIYVFHLDYHDFCPSTPLQLKGHNIPFRQKELVIDVMDCDYDSALEQAKNEYRKLNPSQDPEAPIRVVFWENA